MPTVRELLTAVEATAPPHLAYSFDRIGLQIGDPGQEVDKVLVCLDCSEWVAKEAVRQGAQLVIAHHPLIWEPLKGIRADVPNGRAILTLLENRIAFIAAHTNWDCAPGGINDTLAGLLGLTNIRQAGAGELRDVFKLVVFAPQDAVGTLIDALSEAGAGILGNYTRCAYSSPGTGTFLGGPGSNPAVGSAGNVEVVPEVRLEMRVPASRLSQAVAALQASHPYEEPAYDLIPLKQEPNPSGMTVGELSPATSLRDFVASVDKALSARCLAWGDPERTIRKVGIIGGAAGNEWPLALKECCDAYLTGEIPHHQTIAATEAGLCIIQAGHFATENPGMRALAAQLFSATGVDCIFTQPPAGFGGRSC